MPPFTRKKKLTRSTLFVVFISLVLVTWLIVPLVAAPPMRGARIEIKKYIEGEDADIAPGPQIPVGTNITWTYYITNTGDVTINNIKVWDDDTNLAITCPPDSNTLEPGSLILCTANGTAQQKGQYKNTGCVRGSYEMFSQGPTILIRATEKLTGSVEDCDVSHYIGTDKVPSITVEKYISTDGGISWLDVSLPDDPDRPNIPFGESVLYKYVINNTGEFLLQDVTVTDNAGILADCPEFPGEKNKIRKFSPHNKTICFAEDTAKNICPFQNVVTVTGKHGNVVVRDEDASYYCGFIPGSLKVCKVEVVSENDEMAYLGEWGMQVRDPSGNTFGTHTSSITGCTILSSLIPGHYTVTEDVIPGWMNVTSNVTIIPVVSGEQAHVTFKNIQEENLGSLEVCKYNVSQPYSGWDMTVEGPYGYQMTLSTGRDSEGCTIFMSLVPGNYTVTEDSPDRWVHLTDPIQELLVKPETMETVDFVNAQDEEVTSLTVCKYNGTALYRDGWRINVTGPWYEKEQVTGEDGCTIFEDLVIGEDYRVWEERRESEWVNLSRWEEEIVAIPGLQLDFTNALKDALTTITVCKYNEDTEPLRWEIHVTGPGYDRRQVTGEDGCTVFDQVLKGESYLVEEEEKPDWVNWTTPRSYPVIGGETESLTFINKFVGISTTLQVCKYNITGDLYLDSWKINVTGSGYEKEQVTGEEGCTIFDDLIPGETYLVTEENRTPWRNYTAESQEITAGEDLQVDFVNIPPGVQVADLSIEKTVEPTTAFVRQNVTWHINLTNYGPDAASQVYVYDYTTDLKGAMNITISPTECAISPSTNIECFFTTLPAGTTIPITIRMDFMTAGQKNNTVEVVSPSEIEDPDFTNNIATADVTIVPRTAALLTLIKRVQNDHGGTATSAQFGMTINGTPAQSGVTYSVPIGVPQTINETGLFGYQFVGISGNVSCPNVLGGTITLNAGESATCTITNDDIIPILNVTKHVINDNGGQYTAHDFQIEVEGTEVTTSQFEGSEDGRLISLDAGSYRVQESHTTPVSFYGYTTTYSADCEGTIKVGERKNCTITNNDKPAHLKLVKQVSGGSADSEDWNLTASGATTISGYGVVDQEVPAGVYSLSESGPGGYAAGTWECTFTIANYGGQNDNLVGLYPGQSAICTITNTQISPQTITVNKDVLNNNNGRARVNDFQAYLNDDPIPWGSAQQVTIGEYYVTESGPSGYNATYTGDCDATGKIVVQEGDDYLVCTITNDDREGGFATIRGTVFDDQNENGVLDVTEPGISEINVTLSFSNGATTTTMTDVWGDYTFSVFVGSDVQVTSEGPGGEYYPTTMESLFLTPLEPIDYENNNFGYSNDNDVAVIFGIVFDDINSNGVQEFGEPGLPDAVVNISHSSSLLQTVTTEASGLMAGTFTFTLDTVGIYQVDETNPPGYRSTTPDRINVDVDRLGGSYLVDFGDTIRSDTAAIYGTVFDDINFNSIWDPGEGGLPGVNITLWKGTDLLDSTLTDLYGRYTFSVDQAGDYSVHEENLPGYISTTPDQVDVVGVSLGNSYRVDFSDTISIPPDVAIIYGTIFDDCNVSGVQDGDELGIEGVSINVTTGVSEVATNVTGEDGQYTFLLTEPGYYTVYEENPAKAGYHSTTPDEVRVPVELGQLYPINFGDTNCSRASFFGTVFNDTNTDGQWNLTELGLEGVNVTLVNLAQPFSELQDTTNMWGQYSFPIDQPDTYLITEENLPGYISTNAIPGDTVNVTVINNDTFQVNVAMLSTAFGNNLFGDTFIGYSPSIEVAKSVSNTSTAGPWGEFAIANPGTPIWWNITVTNDGTVPLSLTWEDTFEGSVLDLTTRCEDLPAVLRSSESYSCVFNTTTDEGLFTNTVTVNGTYEKQVINDTGSASYLGTSLTPFATITACKANVSWEEIRAEPGWQMNLDGPGDLDTSGMTGEDGCTIFNIYTDGTYVLNETPQEGWTRILPSLETYTFVITSEDIANGTSFAGVFYNYNGTLPLAFIRACKASLSVNGLLPENHWMMQLEHNGEVQIGYTGEPFADYDLPPWYGELDGCVLFPVTVAGTYNLSEELRIGWSKLYPTDDNYTLVVEEGTIGQFFDRGFLNYNSTIPPAIIGACKGNVTAGGGAELLDGWEMYIRSPDEITHTLVTGTPFEIFGIFHGCAIYPVTQEGTYTLWEEEPSEWTRIYPEENAYTFTITAEDLSGWGKTIGIGQFLNYFGLPPVPFAVIESCKSDLTGTPLAEWQMNLLGDDGSYQNKTTTSNGCVPFIVDKSGRYTLFETMKEGWRKEVPFAAGYEVDIIIPDEATTPVVESFSFNNSLITPPYATIEACKNESGGVRLIGWQMNLLGEDGSYQNGMTDESGCTVFTVNSSGNYTLFESMQENWTRFEPSAAGYTITVTESWKYGPYTFENRKVPDPYAWIHACKNDTQDVRLIGWEMVLGPSYAEITDDSGCTVFTVPEPGSYSLAETLKEGWVNITPSSRVIDVGDGGHFYHTFVNNYSPDFATITACKKDMVGNNLSDWKMNIWREEDGYYENNLTDESGCGVFTVETGATYTLFESMQEGWTKIEPIDEAVNPTVAHYEVVVTEPRDYRYTFVNDEVPGPHAYVSACKNDAAGAPLIGWAMILSDDSTGKRQVQSGMTDDTGCTVFTVHYGTTSISARLDEVPKLTWVNYNLPWYNFIMTSPGTYTHTFINLVEGPAIDIEKFTNEEDADEAPGPSIKVGSKVNWSYVVTNTGSVPLTDITITDNREGVIGTISFLEPGQSIPLYHEDRAKNGPYSNTGNVTAWYEGTMVTDVDASHYTGTPSPGPTPRPPEPNPPIGGGFSIGGTRECDFIETGELDPSLTGVVPRTITICAVDGIGRLIVSKGTIALSGTGIPLELASIIPSAAPQGRIAGFDLLPSGYAYDLQPSSASFRGPATLKLRLSAERWEMLQDMNLVFGLWNPTTETWEEIAATLDPEQQTITAPVSTFGLVGLFNKVPIVPPVEPEVQPEPVEQPLPAFNSIPYLLLALLILLAVLVARWWSQRPTKGVPGGGEWMPGGEFILTPAGEAERDAAFSSIINILNDVDGQVKDLETTVARGGAAISPQDASAIVERFFITAQVAEERMKDPDVRQYLTDAQVKQLNTQLQNAVAKMRDLSRQSESLLNAMQAKYGEAVKI